MKTKALSIVIFAAVALTASWNYQQNKQKARLSDLALENIEALASGESSGGGRTCYDSWRKAPDDDSLAYWAWICQECESYWVVEASNQSSC